MALVPVEKLGLGTGASEKAGLWHWCQKKSWASALVPKKSGASAPVPVKPIFYPSPVPVFQAEPRLIIGRRRKCQFWRSDRRARGQCWPSSHFLVPTLACHFGHDKLPILACQFWRSLIFCCIAMLPMLTNLAANIGMLI